MFVVAFGLVRIFVCEPSTSLVSVPMDFAVVQRKTLGASRFANPRAQKLDHPQVLLRCLFTSDLRPSRLHLFELHAQPHDRFL